MENGFRTGLLVAASCVLVAGCSTASGPSHEEITKQWQTDAQSTLPHYPEANEAQLAIFRQSLESGEVTYQDYKERMQAYVACLEGSIQGRVDFSEQYEQLGLPIIEVGIVMSEGEDVQKAMRW